MSGKSCRAIAMDLTLDGIPTASQYALAHGYKVPKISTYWSDSRIREILLNEVYIGNMVQGRTRKINYKSKKSIKLPKEQWIVKENMHEAIIDKKIFLKAKEMMNTRKHTRVKTHDYLLKGLVYCKECGRKVGCSPRKLAEGNVYYFRCSTYTSYARLGYCTSHSIRMDYVEKTVINKIKSILENFNETDKMIDVTRKKINEQKQELLSTNDIESYKLQLSKINLQINSIYNDKLNNILSQEDFERIYEMKKKEKNSIINKIEKLENNNITDEVDEKQLINSLVKKFNSNFTINREILCSLIDKIEIDNNKKIYLYFKFKTLNDDNL